MIIARLAADGGDGSSCLLVLACHSFSSLSKVLTCHSFSSLSKVQHLSH